MTVKKLALATQLAVYQDVIPGYRIRPVSEMDAQTKISKEVRRLRNFEQALVTGYQGYVRELGRLAKGGREGSSDAVLNLASVAVSCTCALLTAVPHFNFRGDLLQILVSKLSGRRVDEDFAKCRRTLETLFESDEDGTPSLDATVLLTKMIKARNYRVDQSVLNTLLSLRLLSEFSQKGSHRAIDKPSQQGQRRGKREFRTKKQRKLDKERQSVAHEMREADASVGHEERDRMQAETLKLVFVTYFRILKLGVPSLTGAVLEGLAKYAHLINQDFFGDLLEALKDLIRHAEEDEQDEEAESGGLRNSTREALLCIITAFALLHGQDRHTTGQLNLDLKFFITHLYRKLPTLSLEPDLELSAQSLHLPDPSQSSGRATKKVNHSTASTLLLRSLSSVLLPSSSSQPIPPMRLAAFTKTLLSTTLHLPFKTSLATLFLLERSLLKTPHHARRVARLWHTEERSGDGTWDPLRVVKGEGRGRGEGADIESTNPYAATIWEGELLRLHYCPDVRDVAAQLERGIMTRP